MGILARLRTNPSRADIKNVFTNVYDIQPLFPLLNVIEMLGSNNDLSSHVTDIAIWQSILSDRLLTQSSYVNLFSQAFPSVSKANLYPGHIGRALGAFMKARFKSNNAPIDKYIEGDLLAMTEAQKNGMILFYTKGQCFRCHSGSNFTDQIFHSVGSPQIGFSPFTDDTGRMAATSLNSDIYKFKTPSLRNLSLTAPYMHDGALDSIEAVVNHYNNIPNSLSTYQIPTNYQSIYEMTLVYDNNNTRNQSRINQIDIQPLRTGLNLSTTEKTDLVNFIRNSLTDASFK